MMGEDDVESSESIQSESVEVNSDEVSEHLAENIKNKEIFVADESSEDEQDLVQATQLSLEGCTQQIDKQRLEISRKKSKKKNDPSPPDT